MESVEKSGRTTAEAVEAALKELGADAASVQIEVLSEGEPGFFGLWGQKPARVRVTRKRIEPSETAADASAALDAAGEAGGAGETGRLDEPPASEEEELSAVEAAEAGSGETDRADAARRFVAETARLAGLKSAAVTVETSDDAIQVKVEGDPRGLLIGRHGQVLEALQYLCNLSVGRSRADGRRILVDVEGYRQRRVASLQRLALRTAERVQRLGRPVRMEAMSAQDRRVIHLTLQGHDGVTTASEGEDPFRCIVVSPK